MADVKISLYDKTGKVKLGELVNCIDCYVEEERNGLFELNLSYPISDNLHSQLEEENIIVANANDTLLSQKFRIYLTRKVMDGIIEVYARHISFDLAYDYVNDITFTNQSCEYALNSLFRQSQFSTHYRGYSDIINAQDYSMSMCNILEAIAGKKGSIIDTYGNGAEILRDNTNIHILNRRGNDNGVTIEYRKNLTGFDLEEDTTDLITRIIPYAKYNQGNEEVIVKAPPVDSKYINNYSHPYIRHIDYSDKFRNGEIPTPEKLTILAENDFRDNRKDIIKQNFKIQFIPLSRCVGYEGLEDRISLCDTVTVINTMYDIETQVKVIKYTYDVLTGRYKSIELGEPKTTLGDIIAGPGNNTVTEEEVRDIVNNAPSTNYPNTLPSVPVVTLRAGLGVIAIDWTFESKTYYTYEVYASRVKDFTPNAFDLIFKGQASSFSHYTEPNQTWYYRVRAINTHGSSTAFSEQKFATTGVIDPDTQWIAKGAIGDAQIGTLSLDRGWVDQLKGQWIDARQLTVTDGNGKRTLDIDSFGNLYGDFTEFTVRSKTVEDIAAQGGVNLIPNPTATNNIDGWATTGNSIIERYQFGMNKLNAEVHCIEAYGDGLAMLIKDCTGKIIFVDGGYAQNAQHCIDYMKSIGVTNIDYYIITHCHTDHAQATPAILESISTENLIIKELDKSELYNVEWEWKTPQTYDDVINKANQLGVNILEPRLHNVIKLTEDSYIQIYNSDNDNYENYNHQSLAILYVYKNNKVLIMGDCTNYADLSCRKQIGKVDILQPGHHGDGTIGGSSRELIEEVKARHIFFASNYLSYNDTVMNISVTLNRVSWCEGISYSFGEGHNKDFKFILDGNSVTTTATKEIWSYNRWYERIPGEWYWFKGDGYLFKDGQLEINGKVYNFDKNGVCLNP